VFTVCPSKPDVRPGMILAFELFLLRGAVLPTDRVVAWGVFPISNSDFNIIEGRWRRKLVSCHDGVTSVTHVTWQT
jgi:hypothetical protein